MAVEQQEWRFRRLEERVKALEETKPEVLAERISNLGRELRAMREDFEDEVRSLRRAFYTCGVTVVAGAIIFALSLLQVAQ